PCCAPSMATTPRWQAAADLDRGPPREPPADPRTKIQEGPKAGTMRFLRILGFLFVLGAIVLVAGGIAAWVVVQRYTSDLPDYTQLARYDPPVVTRVLAGDGRLLAEYALEKRVYLPIGSIPKRVINAFLAAEDKSFYSHPGIDVLGIVRASLTNLTH